MSCATIDGGHDVEHDRHQQLYRSFTPTSGRTVKATYAVYPMSLPHDPDDGWWLGVLEIVAQAVEDGDSRTHERSSDDRIHTVWHLSTPSRGRGVCILSLRITRGGAQCAESIGKRETSFVLQNRTTKVFRRRFVKKASDFCAHWVAQKCGPYFTAGKQAISRDEIT